MKRNLLTGALAAGLAAIVAGAVAALPAAADHGHGHAAPSPPPEPTPACALVRSATMTFVQDRFTTSLGSTQVLNSGVATVTVTLADGAASCTDVVYGVGAFKLVNSTDVSELAYTERHGTGAPTLVFRLAVPQHPGRCVRGFVRVLRDGVVTDVAPDDLADSTVTNEACDPGSGSPAGTGWS